MERDKDNLDHGNKLHNDSLQEESKITAGVSTEQHSQSKVINNNSKQLIGEHS